MIRVVGYSLSGLPDYGVDGTTVYRRDYTLLDGARPKTIVGPWRRIGVLPRLPETAAPGLERHELELACIDAGLLRMIVDHTGTPHWVVPLP